MTPFLECCDLVYFNCSLIVYYTRQKDYLFNQEESEAIYKNVSLPHGYFEIIDLQNESLLVYSFAIKRMASSLNILDFLINK